GGADAFTPAELAAGIDFTISGLDEGEVVEIRWGYMEADGGGYLGDSTYIALEPADETGTVSGTFQRDLTRVFDGEIFPEVRDAAGEEKFLNGFALVADDSDGTPGDEQGSVPTTNENAAVAVEPEVVSAEDLVDEEAGVTFVVSGLVPGTTVANSLTDDTETADAEGVAVVSVYYQGPAADFEPGQEVPVELTLTDPEGEETTLSALITIAGEPTQEDDEDDDQG
ncbi:hypothetical protein, partial [Brevibacterium daeguense]|uniref:hypothetical protein n=1 Tax=Brevibacterium daeguense TaxID=909936 RepID=UPI003CD0B403